MRSWSRWKVVGGWIWLLVIMACGNMACTPKLRIRHQDPSTQKVAIQLNGEVKGTLKYGEERHFSLKEGVYRLQILTLPQNINKWSDDGQPWEFYLERSVEITLMPLLGTGEGEWDLFLQDLEPQVVPEEDRKLQRLEKMKKGKKKRFGRNR